MAKSIIIKLVAAGTRTGPFDIIDQYGEILVVGVTKQQLIAGYSLNVGNYDTFVVLQSTGKCHTMIEIPIVDALIEQIATVTYTPYDTGSIWVHLKSIISFDRNSA